MASLDETTREREPLLSGGLAQNRAFSRSPPRPHNAIETRRRTSDPGKPASISADIRRSTNTLAQIAAAMFSFIVLGMLVSTLGVMVPQFEAYYHLTDLRVSSIFLVWPSGYVVASYLNGAIHSRFGRRGVAAVGPLFHVVMAAAAALHPPFPVLLVAMAVGSLGTGVLDGSFCAWAGGMRNANVVQGFLHGSYSAGAAVGPFLAGTMLEVGRLPWYAWYYVLLGASVLEAVALLLAFRFEDAASYRSTHTQDPDQDPLLSPASAQDPTSTSVSPSSKTAIFKHTATWICALYFLACVGTENAISGWIVVFMTRGGRSSPYLASLTSSLFWVGQAAGRVVLGALANDRLGVRRATTVYLLAALVFEALFVASVRFIGGIPAFAAAAIALLGFCLGPLFPSGVYVLARLLPREMHVGAVSFVVLVGQVGGAVLPFALGALVEGLGIQVFQVVVFVLILATLGIWLAFPRLPAADAGCGDRGSGRGQLGR
ncbi:MFS general substrate transporter [Annulohypoxylon truncatum]|uniref:MFS general substrate transporter n=1 Tax=Annulohypoxylon truncatum TaxID=327061 RepID=UPI00200815EA|nr:MFS general substrate transporter [Annulohypoxylon truncatum]KAI1208067.1 MFS general substrate transporter [Annulohypoxylon truncatum]